MVVKLKNKHKGIEVPVLDERVVGARLVGADSGYNYRGHTIRFDVDSYVMCFTGRRGGGKTTAMSCFAVRAAALYRSKIIANYPIEFYLRRHRPDGKSYLEHYVNEPFDFEKLILHGEEYRHALILLDEAPDVISHMASMSFKNRLVAAWVRQLRKNNTTLLMCAQSDNWIDKSMRWQIDIRVDCKDVSRSLGDSSGLERGEMLSLTFFDDSGQWTGVSTEERQFRARYGWNDENDRGYTSFYAEKIRLFPRILFGDDDHKPVFDSWHQIDILDSLRKVDLKLSSIKIRDEQGDAPGDTFPVSPGVLRRALESIETVMANSNSDWMALYYDTFYDALGLLGDRDKNNLGKLLSKFNIERGRDNSNGKRFFTFNSFDIENFRGYVEQHLIKANAET